MRTVRIGTRDSALALVQARMVQEAIEAFDHAIRVELVPMKTSGDRILDRPLDEIGGKGLFVQELDEALLAGLADLTVHSYKDLPAQTHPDLPVVAVGRRGDARDVLILPPGVEQPDYQLPVGCSSARRRIQLAGLYPDWTWAPVRGNVPTRLRKLDEGQYGGLVLAAAGIERLGLWTRVKRVFTPDEMLPAACQGTIAVQARRGWDPSCLGGFHCADTWNISQAERAFVLALDGGCSAPTAAWAELHGESLRLRGLYVDADGRQLRGEISGPRGRAEELGERLARRLRRGEVSVCAAQLV